MATTEPGLPHLRYVDSQAAMYPRTLDADQDTKVDADGGERTDPSGDKMGWSLCTTTHYRFNIACSLGTRKYKPLDFQ